MAAADVLSCGHAGGPAKPHGRRGWVCPTCNAAVMGPEDPPDEYGGPGSDTRWREGRDDDEPEACETPERLRYREGDRVRLRRDVDRYPHFIAKRGSTGVIVHAAADGIDVRMDDHLGGAEEWDNEVCWSDADLPAFDEDVERIDTGKEQR